MLLLMSRLKPLLVMATIVLIISSPTRAQKNLRAWVGKYPVSRERQFHNVFRTSPLNARLRQLLGPSYYRRITFDDHFVMGPISLVADRYSVIAMCEQHNCVSKQTFVAVNIERGDVHVALYHYGTLDW